jgi:hypothetical protein
MKSAKTIDEKHSEIVAQFSKNNGEVLPKLREEIESLKIKIKNSKKKNIDEYMEMKDAIQKKKIELRNLTNEEKKYKKHI